MEVDNYYCNLIRLKGLPVTARAYTNEAVWCPLDSASSGPSFATLY